MLRWRVELIAPGGRGVVLCRLSLKTLTQFSDPKSNFLYTILDQTYEIDTRFQSEHNFYPFQTNQAECIPHFIPNWPKNHTQRSFEGNSPPPLPPRVNRRMWFDQQSLRWLRSCPGWKDHPPTRATLGGQLFLHFFAKSIEPFT